ncbi:YdeI/OmpD-associated family protein [Pseudoflavitalea rhizosphaerae]|uniref:YdeI/OmpD-associated family protein n=1 Tax=Pseudoflavitalea rhizosphaerae TaxID=1884793 RepID=UPI000F8CB7D1|nr:YdeI/OmpD-associated family protein [Pseudoflavitalea rhizosphaerae]
MVKFTATIQKFEEMGDKTGWSYIKIPAAIAQQLSSERKSFRVKGRLDKHAINGISLLPMGGGDFILALKAEVRKAIGKQKGAKVEVQLALDKVPYKINQELLDCLADEPAAQQHFNSMPPSHQAYWSKWIESAKTEATKTKRLTQSVIALAKKFDYGQMIRSLKQDR